MKCAGISTDGARYFAQWQAALVAALPAGQL